MGLRALRRLYLRSMRISLPHSKVSGQPLGRFVLSPGVFVGLRSHVREWLRGVRVRNSGRARGLRKRSRSSVRLLRLGSNIHFRLSLGLCAINVTRSYASCSSVSVRHLSTSQCTSYGHVHARFVFRERVPVIVTES